MKTLITTHHHVDFDGLASALAAQKLYPESEISLPHPLSNNVRSFLNLYRDFLPLLDPPGDVLSRGYQLLVMVDTSQKSRINKIAGLLDQGMEVHVYDHHTGQESEVVAEYSRIEPLGAVTTLMVEEIKLRGIHLEDWEATLLAMGIYEDTGNLMFHSTTPRDVEAVNYLWKFGLKTEMLQEFLQHPFTASQKTLLEKLISQTEFYEINQRKILVSHAAFEGYVHGIGEMVGRISGLGDGEVTFCLVEMEGKVLLTGRTSSEDVSLLDILKNWKVKGHAGAVSATFKDTSLSRVHAELLDILEANLSSPMKAETIAAVPVNVVDAKTRVSEALNRLYLLGHSGFPVMDGGKLTGVVSRKDLEKARRSQLEHAPVKGFMSKKIIYARPQDSVNYLRNLMISHNIGRIPLVNEKGELTGIVTRSDVLRSLYRVNISRESSLEGAADGEGGEGEKHVSSLDGDLTGIEDLTPVINRELPTDIQSTLWFISQVAQREEARVYLVGGSIRDLLLRLTFPKDLDLVVLPDAISFAHALNRFFGGKIKVFEPFGTASIFFKDGTRVDLVTARKEFYAAPGKLPEIEVSSLKNDLFRRDFSINTLACSLNLESFGKLFDFFGGKEDLQDGIIRILYHLSFVDDPLRILRAVRFEQRFGFTIEKDTANNLKHAVKKRLLEKVSRERLNGELRLAFKEEAPVAVLKRLHSLGILRFLFPCLKPDYRTWWRMSALNEIIQWSQRRKWERDPDEELIYLAGLLYNYSREEVLGVSRRMHYSRARAEKLLTCCRAVPEALEKLKGEGVKTSTVYNILDPLPDEALLILMAVADDPRVKDYPRLYWDSLKRVRPRLGGSYLKQMGFSGPFLGKVLEELKNAILDGRIRTVEEEKEFVLSCLDSDPGDTHRINNL